MSTSEEDAPYVISKLVAEEAHTTTPSTVTIVKPTTRLFISTSQNVDMSAFDVVISCTPSPIPASSLKTAGIKHCLHLKCNEIGKLGSRDLRSELPLLAPFLSSLPAFHNGPALLVCCPTGKDLSVGTALAILCLFTSDTGAIDLSTRKSAQEIDKNFIKQRLSWITMSNPALNPSRATLQSVNTVLLASQDPKAISLPIRPRVVEEDKSRSRPSQNLQAKIFNQLAGETWSFHRTLTSQLPTHPSGTVSGTATFTPCILPSTFPSTLLYEEAGEFVMENGLKASARRKYIYQLVKQDGGVEDEDGEIVVKFHTDSDLPSSRQRDSIGANGEGIGELFVEMGPLTPSSSTLAGSGEMTATNKSQHLCAADLYSASWKFGAGMTATSEDVGDMWWEVRYDVKGPKKDYVSWTRYERGT
jgi:tRNA A64-2'-O-ribosylphosphate transferase